MSDARCRDCGGRHPNTVDGVRCDLAHWPEGTVRDRLARLDLSRHQIDHLILAARKDGTNA